MPTDPQDAHDLIDLNRVAQRLGITPLFLRWSLDAGLPLIFQTKDGRLSVSMGQSEDIGPAAAMAPQAAASNATDASHPPPASPENIPESAPRTEDSEVSFLRQHLSGRDNVVADKDKLLAELALRIAGLGETAIERSFSAVSERHEAAPPRVPLSHSPPHPATPQQPPSPAVETAPLHTAPGAAAAPRIPLPSHAARPDPEQTEINRRHELAIQDIRDTLILIRNYLAQLDPLGHDGQ